MKYGSEASLDADLTYAMNQSTDEAWRRDPRLSFRAPQRDSRWRTIGAGPALFGGPSRPHKNAPDPPGCCV